MPKKDNIKNFFNEIYSKPPKENYETITIIYNQIDEMWSIDLADFLDYKTSNNKRYRYIFIIIDTFSKNWWAIPHKNKNSQAIRQEFSNILSTSKRYLVKIESDRGPEWYDSIFQKFLKNKNVQHDSRYTDTGPSVVEQVIRLVRNLSRKPIFEKGNGNWLCELSSITKNYNNAIHNAIKMIPIQASKKLNEKEVFSNLQDKGKELEPKFKLGRLVRTADFKRVFSKGDSTNYSYKIYTITEVIHDTVPTYRINYLLEIINQNLLLPTKLALEQNNQKMKKLNLIQ